MGIVWLVALAVLVFGAFVLIASVRNAKSARERFHADWAKPITRHRDMKRVAHYAGLADADDSRAMDDRTWRDLELDDVYSYVDRTTSVVGQQTLYRRLRNPPREAADRAPLETLATELGKDSGLSERIHHALAPLADVSASILAEMCTRPPPDVALRRAPMIMMVCTVACLALVKAHPIFILVSLGLLLGNIALRFVGFSRMGLVTESARELATLLAAGRRLAAPDMALVVAAAPALVDAVEGFSGLNRVVSWLALDPTGGNELAAIAFTYLNTFLLLDLVAFVVMNGFLREHRGALRRLFDAVGLVDTALSVASLRAERASQVTTNVTLARELGIEGVIHPLVDEAVPNDVMLSNRGLFITGSNMAGKSTFLKSVAVNVVLAQALGTAFAKRYSGPFLEVRTLMQARDSILERKSHFLDEVTAARERLEAASDPDRRALLLVDEPFRGTSTPERIGASKAYLQALAQSGALVIAASHDRELAPLLAPNYDAKHFTERVGGADGDEVVFDYTLASGVDRSQNALRILAMAGFPGDVVAEAERVAKSFGG